MLSYVTCFRLSFEVQTTVSTSTAIWDNINPTFHTLPGATKSHPLTSTGGTLPTTSHEAGMKETLKGTWVLPSKVSWKLLDFQDATVPLSPPIAWWRPLLWGATFQVTFARAASHRVWQKTSIVFAGGLYHLNQPPAPFICENFDSAIGWWLATYYSRMFTLPVIISLYSVDYFFEPKKHQQL